MKYIKLFNTEEEYESYINSSDSMLPNVSLCLSNNSLHFNKLLGKFKIVDDALVAEGGVNFNNYALNFNSNNKIKINNNALIL